MKWFVDKRNETSKEHPFKLEKIITINFYQHMSSYEQISIKLTIDNDKDFTELLNDIKNIIEEKYKKWLEVYFSVTIKFSENGNEVNIYDKIIQGLKVMDSFLIEFIKEFPCECDKCVRIKKEIKENVINDIILKQILFVQDYYYCDGELTRGNLIYAYYGTEEFSLLADQHRISLKDSPFYKDIDCKNDLNLLEKFATGHFCITSIQISQGYTPELLPIFMLVYEDDTFLCVGPVGGDIKTTYYRIINEIALKVQKEPIRAVLHVFEGYYYPMEDIKVFNQKYQDRIKKSKGIKLLNVLISKQFDKIVSIDMDYSHITDHNYAIKQIKSPREVDYHYVLYPILSALKNNI